jgi:hypothetical protein
MEFACLFRFFDHALDEEPAVTDVVLSALQRDGPSDPSNRFRPERC